MEYEELEDPPCSKEIYDAMSQEEKEKLHDACGKKKKVDRSDRWENYPLENFKRTDEGYLTGEAIVTNIGVFRYMNYDGTFRYELRTREEVFSEETIKSLKGKPVTNDHPTVIVDSSNVGSLAKGFTGSNVRADPLYLAVDMTIMDAGLVNEVLAGKRAISCGYSCDTVEESGVWCGIPYTHVQKNIRMNHVAIVDTGRAGDEARINLDSKDNIWIRIKEEATMEKKIVKLDGADFEVEEKVADAIVAVIARADSAEAQVTSLTAEKTAIEAERDAGKEKLDSVNKELESLKANHVDADKVAEIVKARVELVAFAKEQGAEFKDDSSDVEIKKAVIAKMYPNAKLDEAKDEYVQARFDIAMEDAKVAKEKNDDAGVRSLNQNKTDNNIVDPEKSRKAMIERERNAYKGKKE